MTAKSRMYITIENVDKMRIKADKENVLINSELILRLISNESLRDVVQNSNLYEEVILGLKNILKYKDLLTFPIFISSDAHPRMFIPKWRDFIHTFEGKTEKEKLSDLHSLLEQTRSFVLSVLQYAKFDNDGYNSDKTVKKDSADNIQEKLRIERNKLGDLMSQINTARSSENNSNEKLNELQQQVGKQRERVLNLQQELNDANDENVKEEVWDNKIKQAFENLKEITMHYDCERQNIKWEWYVWNVIIVLIIIASSCWCWNFISLLLNDEYKIDGIIDLIPLYLPFVFGFALMWAAIVQKNRANRLSIALTAKIFNIHYLEQLLLMVNNLAPSTNNGIVVISKSVQDVLKHYIENIGVDDIKLSQMRKIDKDELKAAPLLEIINKILDTYGNK